MISPITLCAVIYGVVDLDSNNLVGTIPKELANLKGLDHLVSSKQPFLIRLEGSLYHLPNIVASSLKLLNRNELTGTIPSFLAGMTDLGTYDSFRCYYG